MEDRSFYVYAHYRLDTMEPFYIGKGKDGRKDVLSRNPIHDRISRKHGHAVVILFDNLTEEEAFFYEREVIEDLVFNEGYEIPCKNCGEFTRKFSYLTNFSFGGEGSCGYIHNKEIKEKISVSGKKRYENEEERIKTSKASKTYWENPEVRKKQSKAVKKSWENQERRKKQSIIQKKRFKNEKERKKISVAVKKSFENPEVRKKCSHPGEKHGMYGKGYKISGEKNGSAKSVYCRELNIIFSYIKLAEKYCINVLNLKANKIGLACDYKLKSSGRLSDGTKLTWKWLEDVDKETLNNAEYIDSEKYEEIIKAKLNENK